MTRKQRRIPAEVHDDNFTHSIKFDAEPWFQAATDDEIRELAKEGWGGDYMADTVANTSEDDDVRTFFDALNAANRFFPQGLGYEVKVDEDAALDYLATERPELFAELTAER